MKIKTSELIGPALEWAVTKCEYERPDVHVKSWMERDHSMGVLHGEAYSTDWTWGGPIIDRERINLRPNHDGTSGCKAFLILRSLGLSHRYDGPTPLIAAMRCYVSSVLGDDVEVPENIQ